MPEGGRALGLETRIERFGRVYPVTNQAQSVVDVLEFEMRRLGVEVRVSWPVDGLGFMRAGVCFATTNSGLG